MESYIKQGDCIELMREIPDQSIDLVLTDPPYGTTQCKWDSVIPFDSMWEQLNRIIKPRGAILLFGAEPFSSALRLSNIKTYKYDWVWEKTKPTGFLNAKKQPLRAYETISVFYKKQCGYYPQGLENCRNVVSRTNRGNYGECSKTTIQTKTGYPRNILKFKTVDGVHPTQKPVDLLEYLIHTYTQEREVVLDFTMGSGSTCVACVNTNRNFIGFEMDGDYFEIAAQRIQSAKEALYMNNINQYA